LVFQVVSKRYEKGPIVLTSNKTFSKAHMFQRTCARRRRNSTGSRWRLRAADDCGGYERYKIVGPAVRFLGGDVGTAVCADEVGAVLAVKAAAASETCGVGMQSGAWHVVRMQDEQRGVVVDRIGALRHPRVGDAMVGQAVAGWGCL